MLDKNPLPTQPAHMDDNVNLSEFDHHRIMLLSGQEEEEGWQAELRRYLKDMPTDVMKDTDIVEWWQVCIWL
jgi:hypothetical protein